MTECVRIAPEFELPVVGGVETSPQPAQGSVLPAPKLHNRPKTRQRLYKPPPALEVPDINDNAAERRRVLNVLAQRRYRERKRQTRKAAESQCKDSTQAASETPPETVTATPNLHEHEGVVTQDFVELPLLSKAAVPVSADISFGDLAADLNIDLSAPWDDSSDLMLDLTLPSPPPLDLSALAPVAPAEPQECSAHVYGANLAVVSTINPTSLELASSSSSSESQSSTPVSSDSYFLPVNELTLLKAWLRISTRIGVTDEVWALTAQSPFTGPNKSACHDHLPAPWRPTRIQMELKHHPVLDFLPWRSARDKAIQMIHLPVELRPRHAQGDMALVGFAYDLEDSAEGLRIWGDDPYDVTKWEIGQVVFEKWWFIFDRDIINQSNRLREARGAPPLMIRESS